MVEGEESGCRDLGSLRLEPRDEVGRNRDRAKSSVSIRMRVDEDEVSDCF